MDFDCLLLSGTSLGGDNLTYTASVKTYVKYHICWTNPP